MKRYEFHGDDAWYDESASGEWVSYDDAEQAERERDEARRELARWRASYAEECAMVAQATALLREARKHVPTGARTFDINYENDTITEVIDVPLADRIDAFTSGQPAPGVKPAVDDAMVYNACAEAHHRGYNIGPCGMRAVLVAALEGRT